MRTYWIQFIVFSVLWLGYFYYEKESVIEQPSLLLFCALVFMLYFFLSIEKLRFVSYVSMVILFMLVEWVISNNNIYTELLLLFLHLKAITQLKGKSYFIFISLSILVTTFLFLKNPFWTIEWILGIFIFYFGTFLANYYFTLNEEKSRLYEELLSEYRQLKRLNLEQEQLTRMQERTRIARDIHDSVGHKMTALLMQIEMIKMKNTEVKELGLLKSLADESLQETRKAVKSLKKEEIGGIASVIQLIRRLEVESQLFVHFTTKKGVLTFPLSNEESIAFYRVIQEALTNAMRHSSSKEVFVTLSIDAVGNLSFTVKNHISDPKPFSEGFGLASIRERIQEVNGVISFYQAGEQFIVTGSIPKRERK